MRKVIIKQRRRTLGDLYKFRKAFEKLCERQRMQNFLITTFDIVSTKQRRMDDNIRGMFERMPTTLAAYRFAKSIKTKMDKMRIAVDLSDMELYETTLFYTLHEESKQ